jgi:inward rectifier potassium channel
LSKPGRKRSEKKAQLVRLGEREIETLGLSQGFWSDLYHRCMSVYWPVFFGFAAALFVALNAVFGFLYFLGHEPIANAAENGPLGYFTSRSRRWRRSAMATCIRRPIMGI